MEEGGCYNNAMKENQYRKSLRPERDSEEEFCGQRFAEMMNHPERYSEEELRAFFNESEMAENGRYVLLARMFDKRKKAACPDTDRMWKAFESRAGHSSFVCRKSTFRRYMWGAVLTGAAAMLAIVLLCHCFMRSSVSEEDAASVIAMTYDETPQHIMLQNDETLVDLSQKDSLSFRSVDGMPVVETPSSVEAVRSLVPRIQKLSTPRGMGFKVILPDGSEVWLNAESTIQFPSAFGYERHVALKGEAYFKVARNEASPFFVASDKMTVRVLGTEFNFKSYTSETSHVALVSGSVEVLCSDADRPDVMLKPGQEAWRDETGKIHVREVDTYAVTQWVSGYFYFDDLSLVEILRELGRWYNLGVIFRNTASMNHKMHFSASRNEPIEQAIENLNRLRKARICIEGTNMVVY